MRDIDVIYKIHKATSWNSYSTHTGSSPPATTKRFSAEKIERLPSVRVFREKAPPLESVQKVLAKVYCMDKFRRAPTPSAGNINKVELTLLSYPAGTVYQIKADAIEKIAEMPAGACENLIYNQIAGGGWLILFSADVDYYVRKYGARSYRFVLLEAGHLCQALQQEFAEAGFASCPIGGFNDYICENDILVDLNLHLPLYILSVGFPAAETDSETVL
jgi:nitroreductase